MLGILHHIREFLLSALKRYSPGRLLQYLLALCRAVFSRRKSKCSDRDSSHEFVPKTLTLAEGKESLSEGGIAMAPMGHVISGSTTPKQAEEGTAADANKSSSTKNDHPPELEVITSEPPLKKGLHYMWTNGPSLFNMVSLLDHPGLIQRSLAHTQIKKDGVYSTDAKKWGEFCKTYASDTIQVNLLATVLLAANMSFLGIPPINDNGLSYLPQRFSYLSLLAALASIVMGSAVRSPRLFTNHGRFYFKSIILILGFPFECFLYSILFFLLAILVHCAKHKAVVQLVIAGILAMLVLCCFIIYWLITEPCNDIDSLDHRRFTKVTRERRTGHCHTTN